MMSTLSYLWLLNLPPLCLPLAPAYITISFIYIVSYFFNASRMMGPSGAADETGADKTGVDKTSADKTTESADKASGVSGKCVQYSTMEEMRAGEQKCENEENRISRISRISRKRSRAEQEEGREQESKHAKIIKWKEERKRDRKTYYQMVKNTELGGRRAESRKAKMRK
ncbi:hypothetical protein BDR07DRAFT_1378985 [Suillus spraguei]|nr:hypothetical protein BDR07DRAFT_1378985 [Suillus spraguei]